MRKFFNPASALVGLALAMGLGFTGAPAQPVGPPNMWACNKINNGSSGATAGSTSVAAVANQSISLCGFNASAGAATATFQLIAGTGASCSGGGTITLTPEYPLPINGNITDHPGLAYYTIPILFNLCIAITGTGPVTYTIYYSQF